MEYRFICRQRHVYYVMNITTNSSCHLMHVALISLVTFALKFHRIAYNSVLQVSIGLTLVCVHKYWQGGYIIIDNLYWTCHVFLKFVFLSIIVQLMKSFRAIDTRGLSWSSTICKFKTWCNLLRWIYRKLRTNMCQSVAQHDSLIVFSIAFSKTEWYISWASPFFLQD